MFSGAIAFKKKDELIPVQLLEKLLQNNPVVFGAAFVQDGTFVVEKDNSFMPIELVNEYQEEHKDKNLVFFFGNYPENVGDDELQPFEVLWNKEGQPVAMAFLDGDFAQAEDSGESSPMLTAVTKLLIPKLQKLYKLCDHDIDKLNEELEDPVTQQDLGNMSISHGTIVLLLSNGIMISSEKRAIESKTFDWGYTTQTYGYGEGEYPANEESQKQEEPKKPSLAEKKREMQAKIAAAKEKEEAGKAQAKIEEDRAKSSVIANKTSSQPVNKPPATATAVKTEKPEAKTTASVEPGYELKHPPQQLKNKELRKWYRNQVGNVPPDWANRVPVRVKTNVRDMSQIGTAMANKDVAPKHIPQPDKKEQLKATALSVGIIHQDERDKIKHSIGAAKLQVDRQSNTIDLERIKNVESKVPTFSEQIGLGGLEETFYWPSEFILEAVAKVSPQAAVKLVDEYRRAYLTLLAEMEKKQPESSSSETADAPQKPLSLSERRKLKMAANG